MKRIPGLDGLRGVAIVAVFFNHTQALSGGFLGVDLFFALSGYLITSILLNEFEMTNSISLRHFYYRRALRLLPALLVFLAIYGPRAGWRATASTLFYFANWQSFESLGPLVHTWSLSIEEQFYILWPMALLGMLRLKLSKAQIAVALTCLVITIILWRLFLLKTCTPWERVYRGTDTHADGLLIGCIFALVPENLRKLSVKLAPIPTWLLLLLFLSASWITAAANGIILTLTALCGGAVILAAEVAPSIMQSRSLVYLGQRSYSFYLWHYPITHLLSHIPGSLVVKTIIVAVLSIAITEASYRLIESPCLKFKDRMTPMTQRGTPSDSGLPIPNG